MTHPTNEKVMKPANLRGICDIISFLRHCVFQKTLYIPFFDTSSASGLYSSVNSVERPATDLRAQMIKIISSVSVFLVSRAHHPL